MQPVSAQGGSVTFLSEHNLVPIVPPHGLDQIVSTFGDIFGYIRKDHTLDPRWQTEQLATLSLPFPIVLSWDRSRHVERITCHKLLKPTFEEVFQAILKAGLESKITSFGGCFSFRPQRSGTKLSTHSWGIAIDLNPESNVQGTAGDIDPSIVAIFTKAGLAWGGDWQGRARDPMHFQFCTGY
jgi:D-alanyl-D-alanine carboxypeptidase